jgi:hypothetical protein
LKYVLPLFVIVGQGVVQVFGVPSYTVFGKIVSGATGILAAAAANNARRAMNASDPPGGAGGGA